MPITAELIRGHTETIILAHLLHRDSYGYEINKSIQDRSEGRYELKEATLYGAFRRLEEGGSIQSYWGDELTGARRRYYRVTPEGRRSFQRSRDEWLETRQLIDLLLSIPDSTGSVGNINSTAKSASTAGHTDAETLENPAETPPPVQEEE